MLVLAYIHEAIEKK